MNFYNKPLSKTRFDTNDENTKMAVYFSIIRFASCNNFEIYVISKYKVKLMRRYYFFIEVPLLYWLSLKLLSYEVVGSKPMPHIFSIFFAIFKL